MDSDSGSSVFDGKQREQAINQLGEYLVAQGHDEKNAVVLAEQTIEQAVEDPTKLYLIKKETWT